MSDLPERHGIRPVQVLAAALAAVTAAFLGSRLGVYGTVVGAGVVSLATTVGGEFYLRSLERTKQAAKRTKDIALTRTARAAVDDPADADADDVRGTAGPPAGRRMRWQVLAGGAVAAFVLGMGVVTGIEALTGSSFSGERGGTVSNVLGGRPQQEPAERDEPAAPPPATSSSQPPSSSSSPPSSETTTSKPTPTTPPSESTEPTEPPESTTTEPEPTTSEPPPAASW